MKNRQILELPVFPYCLCQNWSHPDVFAAVISQKFPRGFVFQPLKEGLDPDITSVEGAPGFIWLVDCSIQEMPGLLSDFFQQLQSRLNVPADQAFSIKAADCITPEATGAGWKIMFHGIPCGELHIYSELKGVRAASQQPLLRLDLCILQKCMLKDFNADICWQQTRTAGRFLADVGWRAKPVESISDVNEALNQIMTGKFLPEELFSQLLAFYNSFFEQLAADRELDLKFMSVFSDSVVRLCQTEMEGPNR